VTTLVIQSLRSFLFGAPAMFIIVRFIFLFLIAFWVLRFFSRTVDYYWRHTIGAFFNWLGVNGDLMMKIIIGLSIGVTILFAVYQWF
jgi:hypothetical protein